MLCPKIPPYRFQVVMPSRVCLLNRTRYPDPGRLVGCPQAMDREAVALSQDPPLPVPSSDASSGSLVAHRGPRSPSSCWVTRGSLSRVVLHVPGIERRPGKGSSHGVGRCSASLQHVSSLQGGTAQQVSHHLPERSMYRARAACRNVGTRRGSRGSSVSSDDTG